MMSSQKFGSVQAENEEREFGELFIHDTYDRRVETVLSDDCPIILGRRGTGKTALATFLRFQVPRKYDAYVKLDLPPIFSQIRMAIESAMSRGGEPLIDDVARLWEVPFWIAIMAELQRTGQLQSASVKTYLRGVNPSPAAVTARVVVDGLASLIKEGGSGLLDWTRLQQALEATSFLKAVQETRDHLGVSREVVVAIDSLDDNPVKTRSMILGTTGLLTAVNQAGQRLHRRAQIKCFVPTELWVYLAEHMPNIGKFYPFEMRWSPDDLIRLACFRFNRHLIHTNSPRAVEHREVTWESPADVTSRVWSRFFPPTAHALRGELESTDALLLRHTQLRPRQLITVCNAIAENWTAGRFTSEQIARGLESRTNFIAGEVISSYSHIHDDAKDALECFAGLDAVVDSANVSASRHQWGVAYRIGAIGPVRSEERPFLGAEFASYQSAEFEFCHMTPVPWTPRNERVAIHPMFHQWLGVKENQTTMVGFRGWWSNTRSFRSNRIE